MVRLEENKRFSEYQAIEKMLPPSKAYLPLSQHLGKACIPEVRVGDYVLRGQRIAGIQAHVYAPIHSSISGKVVAIQDWPHPLLGKCKTVVVENDGLDKGVGLDKRSKEEISNLTAEQIRAIVFEAGIVGMGGASFPTHIKLNPPKPVDTLIVNGAECEPYLTGDYRLMLEKPGEILLAIELVVRCLGVKRVCIAIEDNKPKAIEAFEALADGSYEICILESMYPQGGEKQLIKNILGKEVPRGQLPFDIGVVVQNVATLLAIYEALYFNKPLYERLVTVTGRLLSRPKNILARIGTPIRELIDFCGPLKEEPAKIIIGGPMMGVAQFSIEVPVIKSTTAVLLFDDQEAFFSEESSCIRCGACVRECPIGLMPCLINLASKKWLWPEAEKYGAADCIECGLCNFICPAKRKLVQSIKRAKVEVMKQSS